MKKHRIFLLSSIIATATCFNFSGCASHRVIPASTESKNANALGQLYFLFLSDVHLATNSVETHYGDDTGTALWDTVKLKIDSILNSANPPAFILYTGDLPEHGGSNDTALHNKNISSMLAALHKMSTIKNTPVFFVPGNNDALAGNYCLLADANGKTPFDLIKGYAPYPYQEYNVSKTIVDKGSYMISDSTMTDGYYAAKIMKGLRIIGLNSVIWSNQLHKNCAKDSDAQQTKGNNQMSWLQQQLNDAENAGDKVYLSMHIPPGADAYSSQDTSAPPVMMWREIQTPAGVDYWQNNFLDLISRYHNTVAGIFYGHTHMDEFRMLYDSENTIIQVAVSCPGVSARSGNNPGFKLIEMDPVNKFPTDFTTYYTSLDSMKWQTPYRFSKLKGVMPGKSIYERLKKLTPDDRNTILHSIYTVMHDVANVHYDTLGINIKPVNKKNTISTP